MRGAPHGTEYMSANGHNEAIESSYEVASIRLCRILKLALLSEEVS